MQEFNKEPTWCKETYQRVARETGLSESQVYKWGWDQKNKKAEDQEDENDEEDNENETEKEKNGDNENNEAVNADDMKLQLDLAISQVVINNDELNHGIILPHKLDDITEDACNRNQDMSQADGKTDPLNDKHKLNFKDNL